MRTPILIDSNILIYAINTSSPKHHQAQDFLQEHRQELVVSQQNIFESLRVLTHPKFPYPMTTKEAIRALEAITKVANIINPNLQSYELALELIKKYNLNSETIFDAVLAATALANQVNLVVTDNERDFFAVYRVKSSQSF